GELAEILPTGTSGARRESVIYLEMDRADARLRKTLAADIAAVLADVRAAVRDWPRLQSAMREEAEALPDGEGAALLRWLVDRHFTLLGHRVERRDGTARDGLGILGGAAAIWSDAARDAAIAHFASGGEAPLIMKADCLSTVHRRAPLDMLVLPARVDGVLDGVSIHVGLWTSAALATPPDKVPVLRRRLAALEEKYGFDPEGHAGKALRHALSALPHDLLVAVPSAALEQVALTAMSLADRPRPRLLLVPGALNRHLFAFAWLPRDELSTARRIAIGTMLEDAAAARIANWGIDLGDGGLALLRYMLALPPGGVLPDAAALDAALEAMVRGWVPAVEAALAREVGAAQAARLVLAHADAFPLPYRNRYTPDEAAYDMARIGGLGTTEQRGARLYRRPDERPGQLRLKTYRLGSFIPLSDAVPVLENFGFRVLEENPTPLDGGTFGYIHDYLLELDSPGDVDGLLARAAVAEDAIAAVLEGRAENDAFNQLVLATGLSPRDALLYRAWFRYLRQTGFAYGLDTVASALRRSPDVARRIVDLFGALHAPRRGSPRAVETAERAVEAA
ncbi:MAG TPA: glutamate dehydrogenase, partial [Sphingomonadaceae bacterium]|nr:glutamate dehydrogenase [Sphingomonadaceae bacterium]